MYWEGTGRALGSTGRALGGFWGALVESRERVEGTGRTLGGLNRALGSTGGELGTLGGSGSILV